MGIHIQEVDDLRTVTVIENNASFEQWYGRFLEKRPELEKEYGRCFVVWDPLRERVLGHTSGDDELNCDGLNRAFNEKYKCAANARHVGGVFTYDVTPRIIAHTVIEREVYGPFGLLKQHDR